MCFEAERIKRDWYVLFKEGGLPVIQALIITWMAVHSGFDSSTPQVEWCYIHCI